MEPIQRLKAINEQKADKALESAKHNDLVLSNVQTQEIILKSFHSLIDYLDKRVSKTEVVNQLQQIGTPDALQIIPAVNALHATIKTHKNVDLSEVTKVMKQIVLEAKKIPKQLPKIPTVKTIDYSRQFKGLESAIRSVEKVVKAQKLIAEAPIINNKAPIVNVEKPNLLPLQDSIKDVVTAVNAIVIPEPVFDTAPVEKLLKKANKLLGEILDKPVGRGGGGGGRVSPYESNGIPAFVELINGAIPTSSPSYALRYDEGATYTYIGEATPGTATSAASWRIKRLTNADNTIVWADGEAAFIKTWDSRAGYTYS